MLIIQFFRARDALFVSPLQTPLTFVCKSFSCFRYCWRRLRYRYALRSALVENIVIAFLFALVLCTGTYNERSEVDGNDGNRQQI